MSGLLLLAWSIAPGLFWLWWLRRRDRWSPEPLSVVFAAFWAGVVSAFPAAFLESWLQGFLPDHEATLGGAAVFMIGVVGPVEEAAKLLAMLYAVAWDARRRRHLDEPLDFLVYAGAAALGFASIENVFYVLDGGAGTGLVRAVLSVPGHFLYTSLCGFALGLRFAGHGTTRHVLLAWLAASLVHGLFNTALAAGGLVHEAFLQAAPLLDLAMAAVFVLMVRRLRALSPHRPGYALLCTACRERTPDDSRHCERCGAVVAA